MSRLSKEEQGHREGERQHVERKTIRPSTGDSWSSPNQAPPHPVVIIGSGECAIRSPRIPRQRAECSSRVCTTSGGQRELSAGYTRCVNCWAGGPQAPAHGGWGGTALAGKRRGLCWRPALLELLTPNSKKPKIFQFEPDLPGL